MLTRVSHRGDPWVTDGAVVSRDLSMHFLDHLEEWPYARVEEQSSTKSFPDFCYAKRGSLGSPGRM